MKKIPVSDALVEDDLTETLDVPLTPEQKEWITAKAKARGVSKRQFIRYLLNRIKQAEEAIREERASNAEPSGPSKSNSSNASRSHSAMLSMFEYAEEDSRASNT